MHSFRKTTIAAIWVLLGGLAGASSSPAQTIRTVQLLDHEFDPSQLTIRVGDTVHWVWVSNFHNVESGTINGIDFIIIPDGRFRSGDPDVGLTYDLAFDRAFLDAHPAPGNAYPYYCVVHGFDGMTGVIEVVDCLIDGDCSDPNPCTEDRCVAGVCQHPPGVAACNDADACTAGDVCSNGVCGGTPIPNCCRSHSDCNDGNVCTSDFCEGGVCRSSPGSAAPCDDHDACTGNDACVQGVCKGTPLAVCCRANADCDDSNGCTNDHCESGACLHTANRLGCNDGDLCTKDDACQDGECMGTPIDECCVADDDCTTEPCAEVHCENHGCVRAAVAGCTPCEAAADCDDEDPCTDDTCPGGVCRNSFNEAQCDDGDPCTQDDRCSGGLCAGTSVDACCKTDAVCEDDDVCTDDRCVDGNCVHVAIPTCEQPNHGDDHANPDAEPPTIIDEPPGRAAPQPRLCGALGVIPLTFFAWLIPSRFPRRFPRRLSRKRNRASKREICLDRSKRV